MWALPDSGVSRGCDPAPFPVSTSLCRPLSSQLSQTMRSVPVDYNLEPPDCWVTYRRSWRSIRVCEVTRDLRWALSEPFYFRGKVFLFYFIVVSLPLLCYLCLFQFSASVRLLLFSRRLLANVFSFFSTAILLPNYSTTFLFVKLRFLFLCSFLVVIFIYLYIYLFISLSIKQLISCILLCVPSIYLYIFYYSVIYLFIYIFYPLAYLFI